MRDIKYVFYVECKIARSTWLDKFFIICNGVDKILPMLNNAGLDNVTAYGESKEPEIIVHHVQRFAICRGDGPPDSIIQMHRLFCDIKPNELF